jgi:hypothetical protein
VLQAHVESNPIYPSIDAHIQALEKKVREVSDRQRGFEQTALEQEGRAREVADQAIRETDVNTGQGFSSFISWRLGARDRGCHEHYVSRGGRAVYVGRLLGLASEITQPSHLSRPYRNACPLASKADQTRMRMPWRRSRDRTHSER